MVLGHNTSSAVHPMQQLTSEGQRIVNDLAQRFGFSPDAVTHMLFAVLNGNGSMAQFNHSEFGGSGQWMKGGMLMLGDMFNYALKGSVDALCSEISGILANQPGLLRSGSFQSQSQSGGGQQNQAAGAPMGDSSLFVPDPASHWWQRIWGNRMRRATKTTFAMLTSPTPIAWRWRPMARSGSTTRLIIRSAASLSSRESAVRSCLAASTAPWFSPACR